MNGYVLAFLRSAAIVAVFLFSISLFGCGQDEGPMEKAGEKADEARERVQEKTKEALEETGEAMEEAGDKMEETMEY